MRRAAHQPREFPRKVEPIHVQLRAEKFQGQGAGVVLLHVVYGLMYQHGRRVFQRGGLGAQQGRAAGQKKELRQKRLLGQFFAQIVLCVFLQQCPKNGQKQTLLMFVQPEKIGVAGCARVEPCVQLAAFVRQLPGKLCCKTQRNPFGTAIGFRLRLMQLVGRDQQQRAGIQSVLLPLHGVDQIA